MQPTHRLRSGLAVAAAAGLVVAASPAALGDAKRGHSGAVRFQNIAASDAALSGYRRAPSPAEQRADQELRQRPFVTMPDIMAGKPIHPRGIPGVVVFDYDGDTDLDMYVTNGPGRPNSLFQNRLRQEGRVRFVDVGVRAGAGLAAMDANGACAGDIDNDGHRDLYVLGRNEPNHLLKNRGNGTFTDITAASGTASGAMNHLSCTMADFDGNGLVDIAVANAFDYKNPVPVVSLAYDRHRPNQLFRNENGRRFTDVSKSSGFTEIKFREQPPVPPGTEPADIGLAIAAVDYDQDGDVDIVVANDQGMFPFKRQGGLDRGFNRIHRNDGRGNFEDVTLELGLDEPGGWMGLAFGDFNFDGTLDFFSSNIGDYIMRVPSRGYQQGDLSSRWFLQRRDGTFADPRRSSIPKPTENGADPTLGGLGATPWGWGASTLDYDNDGYTDIIYHGGLDGVLTVNADNQGALLRNKGPHAVRKGLYPSFSLDNNAMANSGANHPRRLVTGVAVGDLDGNGFTDIVSVANARKEGPLTRYKDAEPFDYGSPFDDIATFLQTYRPLPGESDKFAATENHTSEGNLAVEMNRGNRNGSATVRAVGGVGTTPAGRVNRDGVGAVIRFTPYRGTTALHAVTAGSSYVSQNALEGTFGMGRARTGTVEILWPGGVRNKLYGVRAGARITFPEIPCSYTDTRMTRRQYAGCVTRALDDHVKAGTITRKEAYGFFSSAMAAFRNK